MLAQLRLSSVGRMAEEAGNYLLSLVCLEFVSPPLRAAIFYAVRTWIAGCLALGIAFFCQLDSPYWAPVATWIASLPIPGMTISKGMYRIVGSVIGAIVGIVLIALFAQTPELFILALAIWVGGCTLVSNLLRNFRSYASVLAGYTTAIVALPNVMTPNKIFDAAMARGSCTIIGIICAIVITRLFAPHQARVQVLHHLKAVIGDAARRVSFPLARLTDENIYAIAYKLVADLINLDTEIEYAAAESAAFRIHANRARDQLSELFNAISAARAIRSMEREGGDLVMTPALSQIREDAVLVLNDVPEAISKDGLPQSLTALGDLRRRLAAEDPESSGQDRDIIIRQRLFIDYLDFMLLHMENAIHDSLSLEGPWSQEPRRTLNFHRDHRLAWINALRAFVAVSAAGAFWIATAWSSGAGSIIFVAVVCSLFSTLPNPNQAGMTFSWGTLAGSVIAFAFIYVGMVSFDGQFVVLAVALGLVMIPSAVLSALPATNLFGFAFTVNFFAAVAPTNPMNYNVVDFLNNTIALNVGTFLGCLAYKLILPADPVAAHHYVRYRIKRGFEIVAMRDPIPPAVLWRTRMFDRVNRLYVSAEQLGAERNNWMETGLRALHFGNGIIRLRELVAEGRLEKSLATMIRSVVDSIGWFLVSPRTCLHFVRSGVDIMRHTPVPSGPEERRAFYRTLGTLQEMDRFFEHHPQYLEDK